jgi:4-amino-4-deoxy-L-arabinose transferase-like glycosyltransferase
MSRESDHRPDGKEQRILTAVGPLCLCIVIALALGTGLSAANLPQIDYDEGVYWQSLRALHNGYRLYEDVFCSQPPFFLLSIYPFYKVLGSTIASARIGVAILSSLGIPGAYLLGTALAGRAGGIAAIVALAATPLYLAQSHVLQAEGPAVALLLLSVGAVFMWWKHPTGRRGTAFAALCGATLSLGILIKLFNVTACAPILLLALMRIRRMRREKNAGVPSNVLPMATAVAAGLIAILVILAPFLGSLHALMQQVVTFHLAATAKAAGAAGIAKIDVFRSFFATNSALTAAAIIGSTITILRRDWRIVALLAWLAATLIALAALTPLFPRHAIVLVPPLIALIALGFDSRPADARRSLVIWRRRGALLMGLLVFAAAAVSAPAYYHYFADLPARHASLPAPRTAEIAADMERVTTPGQWVITDAQFAAGLADRDAPPWLADTSFVRIVSGYLTTQQLLEAAADPRVHAVVFATDRLTSARLAGFHAWVAEHFKPRHSSVAGVEIWTR